METDTCKFCRTVLVNEDEPGDNAGFDNTSYCSKLCETLAKNKAASLFDNVEPTIFPGENKIKYGIAQGTPRKRKDVTCRDCNWVEQESHYSTGICHYDPPIVVRKGEETDTYNRPRVNLLDKTCSRFVLKEPA